MTYYTLTGVSYVPAPHPVHGIVFQKAARKSTLNTGDTKVVNGVTYTFNENRRWARADKKSRSRRSSPGANKRPPNVAVPVLEDAPKVKGKSRRMTPPAAPKANTEEIARQARRSAPRAMSAEGLPQLKPKGKPAQVKPKGKAKGKKPASGVADMRQSKDTGSLSNEKPAMQQTKATFTPKEVELKIRQAYLKASDGEYVVRVRIAKLRQSLADVPREQFDEILNQMELAGKLTMMHLDDPQEIRPEDEQAAINIGGHMNHIVYMRDWKDEPKAEAKAEAKPKASSGDKTKAVLEAAKATQTGRLGDSKVFISHVWDTVQKQHPGMFKSREDFNKHLLEANRKRDMDLSRADMAYALNQDDVNNSELTHQNSSYHFIRVDP